MSRMRYLKPTFFTDSKVIRLSAYARLLFEGAWCFSDCDAGHLDDDALSLKLKALPADQVDADELLAEIVATGMIVRRAMPDGRTYLQIVHLRDHQKVDARWNTRCRYCAAEAEASTPDPGAPPEEHAELTETPASSSEPPETPDNTAQEGIGGEGSNTDSLRESAQRSRSRGARLPPDWQPTNDLIAQMRRECPGVDLKAEHAKFADHWRAQPGQRGVKLDWPATWRNWMRRAAEHTPRNGSPPDQHPGWGSYEAALAARATNGGTLL